MSMIRNLLGAELKIFDTTSTCEEAGSLTKPSRKRFEAPQVLLLVMSLISQTSIMRSNYYRVYLQHPTRDLPTLKRRQDVIAFFIRPQSDTIMKNICSSLRFVRNVTVCIVLKTLLNLNLKDVVKYLNVFFQGILAKIKALSAKAHQWKSLYNVSWHSCA